MYELCVYLHFRLPTDIQAEAMPLILGGGDVLMVSSSTLAAARLHYIHDLFFCL